MAAETKTIDLFGFGIAAVDDLIEVASFPQSGSKVEVLAQRRQGGGLCATALVAAARLGLRCLYGGLLGHNELSDFTRETLRREGIEIVEDVRYPDAEPFHSRIVVDRSSGERTIFYSRQRAVAPQPQDLRADLIGASRALLVDHFGAAAVIHACRIAKEACVPIIADIENADDPAVHNLILEIDHLISPLRFGKAITGHNDPADVVMALARKSRACTVVTDGVRGCWYAEGGANRVCHEPAFQVDVVDTTGCGDVFHGAYATGLLCGMTIPEIVRFAAATAAIKATRPGGQLGIPDRKTVEGFLQERES